MEFTENYINPFEQNISHLSIIEQLFGVEREPLINSSMRLTSEEITLRNFATLFKEEVFKDEEIKHFDRVGFDNKMHFLVDQSIDAQEWLEECVDWYFDEDWRGKVHMSEDKAIAEGVKYQRRKDILDYLFHRAI